MNGVRVVCSDDDVDGFILDPDDLASIERFEEMMGEIFAGKSGSNSRG